MRPSYYMSPEQSAYIREMDRVYTLICTNRVAAEMFWKWLKDVLRLPKLECDDFRNMVYMKDVSHVKLNSKLWDDIDITLNQKAAEFHINISDQEPSDSYMFMTTLSNRVNSGFHFVTALHWSTEEPRGINYRFLYVLKAEKDKTKRGHLAECEMNPEYYKSHNMGYSYAGKMVIGLLQKRFRDRGRPVKRRSLHGFYIDSDDITNAHNIIRQIILEM